MANAEYEKLQQDYSALLARHYDTKLSLEAQIEALKAENRKLSDECKGRGYFLIFLIVVMIAGSIFAGINHSKSVQNARSEGAKEGYEEGKSDGYDAGYSAGYSNGMDDYNHSGYDSGYETGYSEGYDAGSQEGYANGHFDGVESGQNEGYKDGYNDGYDVGYDDASSGVPYKTSWERWKEEHGVTSEPSKP